MLLWFWMTTRLEHSVRNVRSSNNRRLSVADSSGSLPFNRSTPCRRNIRRSLPSCQTVPTVRFIGDNCPVGVIEPIEVKGHDKTVSRYRENQRISRCSIFLMFVVHNFSPNHSGREQFSCECYRRHLL